MTDQSAELPLPPSTPETPRGKRKAAPRATPTKKPKTTFPTLKAFQQHAQELAVNIVDKRTGEVIATLDAKPRRMQTKNYGWSAMGKQRVNVPEAMGAQDNALTVQLSMNLIVSGSKAAKEDAEDEDEEEEEVVTVTKRQAPTATP
jgi:hypothetical protein